VRNQFRWLLVIAAAIAAVVLFVLLRPDGNDEETATATEAATTTTATAATTSPAMTSTKTTSGVDIAITVENGKPVGGVAKATVKQGQKVALIVHSDVADEVHLHGYDLHRDVEAGGTATIAFTAKIAGRFEAELEDRKEQILSLTVEP
jgi:FtsP/CotA-like multicopper oxidase with cupredoxin domain